MSKIVLIELNEVPFRVIDQYVKKHPNSRISKVLSTSTQYITICEDKIQLDPWISWPTLQRGVIDEHHQILHLGQSTESADKKFPPIWKIIKDKGMKVGVFGSLHSNQHEKEIQEYDFFLPDFFAESGFAHPKHLEPLQIFNLTMTRKSARNVDGGFPISETMSFAKNAPKLGIGLDTIQGITKQLASEIKNRQNRIRRRNTQCAILGDVFIKELQSNLPDFACFYTNHVAAAMHRYWAATFPEDQIGPQLDQKWLESYQGEINAAMKIFDGFLEKICKFARENSEYTILIASSLGQAAIPAQHCKNYLTITDLNLFMNAFEFDRTRWTSAPAMVPDFSIKLNPTDMSIFERKLNSLSLENTRMLKTSSRMTHTKVKTNNDISFIEHDVPIGESFKPPMSFDCRGNETVHINFQWDDYEGPEEIFLGNKSVSFVEAGLGYQPHQDKINCSAQHVSDGSLIVYGDLSGSKSDQLRSEISTRSIAPSVLKHLSIDIPDYMDTSRLLPL